MKRFALVHSTVEYTSVRKIAILRMRRPLIAPGLPIRLYIVLAGRHRCLVSQDSHPERHAKTPYRTARRRVARFFRVGIHARRSVILAHAARVCGESRFHAAVVVILLLPYATRAALSLLNASVRASQHCTVVVMHAWNAAVLVSRRRLSVRRCAASSNRTSGLLKKMSKRSTFASGCAAGC